MMDRMRFGGLNSGIDTHDMIDQMMRVERMRVDRFHQRSQTIQWRQEAAHEMNKRIAQFVLDSRQNFGLNQVSYSGQIRTSEVNRFDWIKSAQSSNESVVRARANANAIEGNHTVEVKQRAEVGSITSQDMSAITSDDGRTFQFGDGVESRELKIQVGDTVQTFTVENGSHVSSLATQIRNATDEDGNSLGLNASYDANFGRMMITTRETGAEQSFTILEDDLGAHMFEGFDADGNLERAGQDAIIEFNGEEVKHHSNNIEIFGIHLDIQGGAPLNEVTTISVQTDVDGMVDKIKEFVNEYNKLLDDMNEQLKQEEYRDYRPLTDEEKRAMSDNEVEMWEERAKSGLLRNDESMTRMMQNLRLGMYQEVEGATGAFNQITQIGITTGNYQDGGKLEIDEDRLRDAINEDAEGVVNLLFKTSSAEDPAQRKAESGLFQRMSDEMVAGMQDSVRRLGVGEHADTLRSVQGNMLIDFVTKNSSLSVSDRDILSINQRIEREERRLARREEQLWAQFTAMEKAMGEMNNQADWLQQQLMQF
ncbi:flagellar hook-associated protein 2 [Tindallia magadiensis]|uniref:Flagellar hook-associated protein 2 n=1 Tax=Tindallia magadiensis TaxID=69895 RepID=A0A1I3C8M2_9FIRM|nr:flagellar filament capping protein FliD [Tindallia magadiensis]SFH70894.1 flagellar hook-associated protein 2 [Tindallia magadiensis]